MSSIKYEVVVLSGKSGHTTWTLNGKAHREDGPAVEWNNGTKEWWLNDKQHRVDGPAVECSDGDKSWYINNKLHRVDGPAIEFANDNKVWYLNGKRHRLNGPAVEYADGDKVWYIEGVEYTEAEFNEEIVFRNNYNVCFECGGPLEMKGGKNRTFLYNKTEHILPSNFKLPTCLECGEQFIDEDLEKAARKLYD